MPPEFFQVLREYGFATTVALAMLYGGCRGAVAFWREMIIPIRDAVLEFIRGTVKVQEANLVAKMEHTSILKTLSDTMHAANRNIEAIGAKQQQHFDVCKGEGSHDKPPRTRHAT